ncbi:DUF5701 family protein [Mycobacteroides abscessus]|uniref:DUF5701 family protein n=1 Tax=Mycobacteroides abscessus TaxID=36809 RepID=UPI000E698503|nr:DUF5701 family protein [Mycobacteroides abscessus]RIS58238.1 hypothetical protein D2E46_02140 [Mycobacteroides abscessus]
MLAAQDEFDRQFTRLRELGYPVTEHATALRARATDPGPSHVDPDDHIPFVLVVPGTDYEQTAPLMSLNERNGFHAMDDGDVDVYRSIVQIPEQAYLLTDIDTGAEFRTVTPETALKTILARGRTPLTIDEGIALVVVRPDMLRKNKCFSLAASRGKGQRWDRNPHTWLGTASCGGRIAV